MQILGVQTAAIYQCLPGPPGSAEEAICLFSRGLIPLASDSMPAPVRMDPEPGVRRSRRTELRLYPAALSPNDVPFGLARWMASPNQPYRTSHFSSIGLTTVEVGVIDGAVQMYLIRLRADHCDLNQRALERSLGIMCGLTEASVTATFRPETKERFTIDFEQFLEPLRPFLKLGPTPGPRVVRHMENVTGRDALAIGEAEIKIGRSRRLSILLDGVQDRFRNVVIEDVEARKSRRVAVDTWRWEGPVLSIWLNKPEEDQWSDLPRVTLRIIRDDRRRRFESSEEPVVAEIVDRIETALRPLL